MYIKVKRPHKQPNIYKHNITKYGPSGQSENDIKVNKLNGMNNGKWIKAEKLNCIKSNWLEIKC